MRASGPKKVRYWVKLTENFLMTLLAYSRNYAYQSELPFDPTGVLRTANQPENGTAMRRPKPPAESVSPALPSLRFEVSEAAQILRMSRAQLYNRICEGTIRPQKDGARTYITRDELERYVEWCNLAPESVQRAAGKELHHETAAG
jgi:hypothetical protein